MRKNKRKAPVQSAPVAAPVAETPVVEEKLMVNCPKCSTSLYVKSGNYAHLCPVCSFVFRVRKGEKLVKDITRKTMVEAFVTIDKNDKGETRSNSIVNRIEG